MTTRCPDILFISEYIKNVLYFATVRQGKTLKNTSDTHYFCIDNELVYENYYADFGPLNLGCVYKYCRILNDKLKQYLNRQVIVHYTSIDPKKKANSAFLLGCYGVLYLSLTPKDALKPLMVHGQTYRPFQDATQGVSNFTISLMDCLQAIKKAQELGFFNFHDFNYEEYDRLDKIQGGDLNWIIPGKFLAFIGPVDYTVSLYHPPEMYIDYFMENNVKIVIRLNKRLYDGNVFSNVGIAHYDLFFPDGSTPPRHILIKFLQISEEAEGAIAVHCKVMSFYYRYFKTNSNYKLEVGTAIFHDFMISTQGDSNEAGLGRTGSLIGCYLIKHYRMTSHEAIGWMRICRPGSVIGHQQAWLEQLEPWLLKQGNLFRRRNYQDTERLPKHNFGVYSVAERSLKQRPVVFQKTASPPPPMRKPTASDIVAPVRPQASKIREDNLENEEEEVFLTSCDLTQIPTTSMTQMKGCIIRNTTIVEEYDQNELREFESDHKSLWKKYLCCHPCIKTFNDSIWMMAVRCARCNFSNKCCICIDMAASNKTTDKDSYEWRVRSSKLSTPQKAQNTGEQFDSCKSSTRRICGAGEPRTTRTPSRLSVPRSQTQRSSAKSTDSTGSNSRNLGAYHPITTFRTTQGPVLKTVNDARSFLMRSSMFNEERERQLNASITVTPQCKQTHVPNNYINSTATNVTRVSPSSFSAASRSPTQPPQRRRLGRSPSPPQLRLSAEQTRATNTTPHDKFIIRDVSKSTMRDAFSRLKLSNGHDGSIGVASVGAASLGARRDAPCPKRAPSVRSDERPLATQGDMLNSIKYQRRMLDSLHSDKIGGMCHDKTSLMPKDKSSVKNIDSRASPGLRTGLSHDYCMRSNSISKSFFGASRPASPKGRRSAQMTNFY